MRSDFVTARSIREHQRDLISMWLVSVAGHFTGRVLDFGCGRQPYRSIVEDAGGEYHGYDRRDLPGSVAPEDVGETAPLLKNWDAILCTQMLQYVQGVPLLMDEFAYALARSGGFGGCLVLTYATNWPEIEGADLHRFTRFGMERLCRDSRLRILEHEELGSVECADFYLPLGYGLVATPH